MDLKDYISKIEFITKTCEHLNPDEIDEIIMRLPRDKLFTNISNIFKALNNQTRLKILFLLLEKDMFVCELTYALDISQSAISHQLQILKNLDLVRANKHGRYTIYSIADDHVKHLINQCTELVTENY